MMGLSCDQEINSAKDQPKIAYVMSVSDSASAAPLGEVRIRATTIAGDTSTYFTDRVDGRVELPVLYSSRTAFVFSLPSYRTLDLVDTTSAAVDTLFGRPLTRLLKVRMVKLSPAFLADTLPRDTLNTKDTLVIHFKQPIKMMGEPIVRLVNITDRLWSVSILDSSNRVLKIIQREDDWLPGKVYAFEIPLANFQGQMISESKDSAGILRGSFYVKSGTLVDSTLAYPTGMRLAYFNSGNDRRFDSLSEATSPKPDSTTRFARLKWNWKDAKLNRVDSILVFLKDPGAILPSWKQWTAIPGFADSATLDFAELYSTSLSKNQNSIFPLRNSATAEIQLKVLYLEGGRILDSQSFLPAVKQEMGPSVYLVYDIMDSLKRGVGSRDTIEVSFVTNPADPGSAFDFGPTPPVPKLYLNDVRDSLHLFWLPVSGKKGRLVYAFGSSESPPPFTRFRADLDGLSFSGKPIWQRNLRTAVGFD
ncbi:MAG: hypothetical protein M3Y08_19245 [Fibrobacterota bacterium]|nr:hypothetical protein [Fibrobacterota bacterium]